MKNLDIFGEPIKVHLNGNYNVKTAIGGWLTLLTILTMFLYSWFNGNDIIYKVKPKTYQEQVIRNHSISYKLTKNDTYFYFQLFDGDKNSFIDSSVVNVKLITKYFYNSKFSNSEVHKINLCQDSNFPNSDNTSLKSLFSQIVEKKYYCPDFGDGLNVYGSWIEQNISFVQIQVLPCINSTSNPVVCKGKKEIDDIIWNKRLYLSIYYPLLSVSLNNFYFPFSYSYKEDYYYLPKTDSYKFYSYILEEIFIKTDYGYLTEELHYDRGQSLTLTSTDIRNIKEADPYFFSIDIYSSFNQVFYARSYIKVSDIMSNAGGMFSTIGTAFVIVAQLFTSLERTKIIISKLFVYRDPSRKLDDEFIKLRLLNKYFIEIDNIIQKKSYPPENIDMYLKQKSDVNIMKNNYNYLKNENEAKKILLLQNHINNEKTRFFRGINRIKSNNELIKNKQVLDNIYNRKSIRSKNGKKSSGDRENEIDYMLKSNKATFLIDNKSKDQLLSKSRDAFQNENDLEEIDNKDTNMDLVLRQFNEENKENQKIKKNRYRKTNNSSLDFSSTTKLNYGKFDGDENIYYMPENEDELVDNQLQGKTRILTKKSNNSINDNDFRTSLNAKNIAEEEIPNIYKSEKSNCDIINKGKTEIELKRHDSEQNRKTIQNPKKKATKKKKKITDDPVPRYDDPDFDKKKEELNKKYLSKLLHNRSFSDDLILSFWQSLKINFCKPKKIGKHNYNFDSKLMYIMNAHSEKVESYFDYIKIIKRIEEIKIIKRIVLDKNQRMIAKIISKQSIQAPTELEVCNLIDKDENKKKIKEESHNYIFWLNNIFQNYKQEKNLAQETGYMLKFNENLIHYLKSVE